MSRGLPGNSLWLFFGFSLGKVYLASVREKLYNEKMDEKIRINKYLSEAGFCSRREADSLIQDGRVTVEGHTAEPGEKITADTVVFVDGKPVKKVEKKVLLLFYKPPFWNHGKSSYS